VRNCGFSIAPAKKGNQRMASLNRVVILGNLGQDPELRYTQNQMAVCTLRIATTDYRTGQDGQRQELTEWHRIVVWGRQAENCSKYLAKGRSVLIEGRLATRAWEDKQGQKRYTTEIVAQNVQFVGGQRSDRQGNAPSVGGGAGSSYGGGAGMSGGAGAGNFDMDMGLGDQGGMGGLGGPDTPGLDDIPF
jgi:single-strand DNA-binding protein